MRTQKTKVFLCFQEVWKCNIGSKLVKVILNGNMNGYLIFTCSYAQAELYSIGLLRIELSDSRSQITNCF